MEGLSWCDIVIPVWNQPDLTRRCLESILASGEGSVQLILVDNGSDLPTRNYIDQFSRESSIPVLVIRNSENLGFIRASNQGIRAGRAPWVCLLNNDTIVTPGWLAEMLKVAESDPRIGLINPTSNSLGFHAGGLALTDYARSLQPLSGQWTELSTALGFCLLLKRSLFEAVGLLDESFGMGNFDDDDLSRKMKARGLSCVRACASYVFHEEKASFRHLPGWEKAFGENRQRFEERWGRCLRILCDLLPEEIALELAREGHWLTFLSPGDNVSREVLSHAQVTSLGVGGKNWRLTGTLRLLLKRKKPFDIVVSHDPAWSKWLKRLQWLISARILDNPAPSELLERCQNLSRSRSWSASKETQPLPAATTLPLSVVVITKNEASRLAECLESVRWAGEIVVVDDESTDETVSIARGYTDRIIHRKMDVEGKHRNFAHTQARYEWILSIDADERVTPELAREIQQLLTDDPSCDIYAIPRRNYIGKRWIRYGGWYPSAQVKLFKRSMFQWEETTVHPRAISASDKPWGALRSDLIHFSYRNISDFAQKLNRQTTLEAQKWLADQRPVCLRKALWRSVDRFVRAYWGKQGYRDGLLGFIVAVLGGMYQLLSFSKYWLERNPCAKPSQPLS